MLKLFKDEETNARLLLNKEYEGRLKELGIYKYCDSYLNLSVEEFNSYIENLEDIEELASIFYSRFYDIENCGMADEIERSEVRNWFINILQRIEEEMDDDIACFKGEEALSVKIKSIKDRMAQTVELFTDGSAVFNGEEIVPSGSVEVMSYIESIVECFSIPRRREVNEDNYYKVTINSKYLASFNYEHSFEYITGNMETDLSDELREILNNEKLFVFDGNQNRLNRLFFKYYRIDKYKGRSFETIELNRLFSSFEYIKNIYGETYKISITGDKVNKIIDRVVKKQLLGTKKGADNHLDDDNCIREYSLTFNFENGEEKVIEGTYDLNGLPEFWPAFMNCLSSLIGNVNLGDVFDKNIYGKTKHRHIDYMLCLVKIGKETRYFIGEDENLKAGDKVIVRLPYDDEAIGIIQEINYYSADEAPVNISALCYIDRTLYS